MRTPRHALAILLVSVVFCACGTATAGEPPGCHLAFEGAALEPGVGFGGLRLGMRQAEVEDRIGPPERRTGNAWEYPACGYALVFDAGGQLAVLLGGGHPLLNERFRSRSDEGLGIGSTREEIVRALGTPTRTSSEGQVLHYDGAGIEWTLTDGQVTHLTIRRRQPDHG
jgi:hypothetical protein